jgi:hypothetical protein
MEGDSEGAAEQARTFMSTFLPGGAVAREAAEEVVVFTCLCGHDVKAGARNGDKELDKGTELQQSREGERAGSGSYTRRAG